MKINSNISTDRALGFEIYHFAFGKDGDNKMQKKYEDMGFMNVYPLCCGYEKARRLAKDGARFWVYAHDIGFTHEITENGDQYGLVENWQENITKKIQRLKDEGVWEAVLGFDYDEPMLQSTNEVIEKVTEEYAKYGKRQRAIFSYYEIIEGSHPRSNDPEFGKQGHIINQKSCRFLTDIGFDWYGCHSYNAHKRVLNEMKRRVVRDNVNIWFVPCTFSIFNRFGQEHAVKHLDTCYKLLKQEKHPGGLTCYNWYSFEKKGESLDWLFSDNNLSRWSLLEQKMLQYANEIINKPLK